MQELINKLPRRSLEDTKDCILLDTCFFIDLCTHQKLYKITPRMGMTSFNIEELVHVSHHLPDSIKESMRKFFHQPGDFFIVDIDVHPGDKQGELQFVRKFDADILHQVPDPSDAVLVVAAVKTHSMILTKDKHDLFTTKLEKFLQKYDIEVYKDLHSIAQ